MRKFVSVIIGFTFALFAAVAIHGLAIGRPVDGFTFAYRAPMALVSPIYILNAMALSGEFYHSIRMDLDKKAGRPLLSNTPNEVREEAHRKGLVYGHLFSGALTAAFWIPVALLFRRKRS